MSQRFTHKRLQQQMITFVAIALFGSFLDIRAGILTGEQIPTAMFVGFLSQQFGRTVITGQG